MYVPALHYLITAITFCTDITLCCIKDACVDMSLMLAPDLSKCEDTSKTSSRSCTRRPYDFSLCLQCTVATALVGGVPQAASTMFVGYMRKPNPSRQQHCDLEDYRIYVITNGPGLRHRVRDKGLLSFIGQ